jgi:prepilin-type N-terminal cleavage/methylation domain-containing protein
MISHRNKSNLTAGGERASRCGFTIMELLVVISVIALLIAMLSPALARAKEAANNTKCLSNLHQIGLAMTAYSDDNVSFLPPYKTPFQPTPTAYWGGILAKWRYIDPGPPFSCPSYDPPRKLHLQANNINPEANWFFTQYGINWQHIGSRAGEFGASSVGLGVPPAPPPTPKATSIRRPPQTIFVVDSWGKVWGNSANGSGITFVGASEADSTTGAPHVRHLGNRGLNVLWGDTHATHVSCSLPANPYTPDALTDAQLTPADNLWDIK